ncbi:unnamed protein product [Paramecium primaurelia]|uniref:Uncharacterized protein n=1 Tax=Paramecium primaurelia TaxID=5886 RepID=A0A8S1P7K9_PARPR|nr:unnamed protein product [Paramecium primaurelia]
MMHLSEGTYSKWHQFLEHTKNAIPLDYDMIGQHVKIKLSKFPRDDSIIDYYQNEFSNITSSKNRTKWHQMDKYLLIWCVAKLLKVQQRINLVPNDQDWDIISELLQVDSQLIKLKWISLLHSNYRIHQWTTEEDQILKDVALQFYDTNNWTELTMKFNSLSRTQRYPKQIRERWKNVLNPSIQKCLWNQQEKINLIQLVYKYGKRWSLIQNHIKSRSEYQIKNQYNEIMRNLKQEQLTNEEERELLLNIIQNSNQQIYNLIDEYLLKIKQTREASLKPQIKIEDIKMKVNNNCIIKESIQIQEQKQETQCKQDFQSQPIQNSIIQNLPQLYITQQNHQYQFKNSISQAQQHFLLYQQNQQYNQQKPLYYPSSNQIYLSFPFYM